MPPAKKLDSMLKLSMYDELVVLSITAHRQFEHFINQPVCLFAKKRPAMNIYAVSREGALFDELFTVHSCSLL